MHLNKGNPPHNGFSLKSFIVGIIVTCMLSATPVAASVEDNLNTAFVKLLSSIGVASDSGSTTVFGKLNGIDTTAKSNGNVLGTINSNVSSIKTSVNSLASASGSVKSVQRGTASGNQTITISSVNPSKSVVLINGVSTGTYSYNWYRCDYCGANFGSSNLMYCESCGTRGGYLGTLQTTTVSSTTQPYCSAMTATSFTVANAAGSYGWQVVEYY